jgi:hypothetical protein
MHDRNTGNASTWDLGRHVNVADKGDAIALD